MTSRAATLLAFRDGGTAPGPARVFRTGPTLQNFTKGIIMTPQNPTEIDEQVDMFRDQLTNLSFIDPERVSTDAHDLFVALASAPTSKETGGVLLNWAAKYRDATFYRNSVATAAVVKLALFIVFDASEFDIRGKDGLLSKLSSIKITCRVLDINLGEVR